MKLVILLLLFSLGACQHVTRTNTHAYIPDVPDAVTNNAVALVERHGKTSLYSFNGLSSGKGWQDIHNNAYHYDGQQWQRLPVPNGMKKVLASTAISIDHQIYVIGGYTVAENHEEKSVPEVFRYDTIKQQWDLVTTMPVPVDDTVAMVYADRYIYLVSGWHDVDNVSLVQVYDTHRAQWFEATEYPAPAVFGHAGGIVDNKMVICDGVKVVVTQQGKKYVASPVCMTGVIDENRPQVIDWEKIPHYSGVAHYRMAAVGDASNERVIFAGGSDNPYNFDGIGYNDVPSEASNVINSYDIDEGQWRTHTDLIEASMDHRALLHDGQRFYIIGGMREQQTVSNKVNTFKLSQ